MSAQESLHDFCQRYFQGVGATLHPSPKDVICVELPREVDKELTDRPFYWMWVDAMNEDPPNTVLYLKYDPEASETEVPTGAKPELIVPGCYRLLRIEASAKSRGMFASAYEQAPIVTPFAVFVVKVSFVCDRRTDFLESYAIDLRNYQVYGNAMDKLIERSLCDERPNHTRVLTAALDVDQLFDVLLSCVRLDVEERNHAWADEAKERLEHELLKLDEYYASIEASGSRQTLDGQSGETYSPKRGKIIPLQKNDEERNKESMSLAAERELRRAEIIWRTEPKIEVRPLQVALAYLASPPS